LLAFLVDRHVVPIPNPAPLFVCIVALAASVSGTVSGMASAVIAVTSSALFFLNHRTAPGYDVSDLARMLLLAATAGGTALITGSSGRNGSMRSHGRRSITPPPTACRRRSIRSISASCCSMPIPAPNSSTAPSAITSSCPTSRPTASRPSSR
jgi:hypothetical protein